MNGSTGTPRVVACVPAYNASSFIEDTLQSLAAQKYPNLRILISVDRSTDDTEDRCQAFARRDSRFSVIVQREHRGWIGNTNLLLKHAQGDHLFLAPHDDLLEPSYVATLSRVLSENPGVSLAFSDMEVIRPLPDGVGIQSATQRYADLDGVASPVERARRVLARTDGWWIPFRGLFRREAARRIGGLRRHLAGEFAADWPFVLHLALLGECVRVPEVLYRNRYQRSSLSRGWRYHRLQWMAAGLSCGKTIAEAELSTADRLRLCRALIRCETALLLGRAAGAVRSA
jgi:glycosyltransferase involved in cell wall biosynthesis